MASVEDAAKLKAIALEALGVAQWWWETVGREKYGERTAEFRLKQLIENEKFVRSL